MVAPPPQTGPPLPVRVAAELHMPGLGLSQKRWTSHSIFMSEVYRNMTSVQAQACRDQQQHGAGVLFVDKEEWLRLVKRSFEDVPTAIDLAYLPLSEARARVDFGPLQPAFHTVLNTYNAAHQFILVACHHPGDMLSCYLFANEPAADPPGAAFEYAHLPEVWGEDVQ